MTYDTCKLLSPVGSMDVLKSAVFSGADFVYLSGKRYGARDYAENFDYNQMKDAVEFCHKYNVKVFVTVNTSILEREIPEVVDYVYYLYINGVDGVIIQDIGLANIISKLIPNLSIHASTQMTVYDYSFVKWLCENSFDNANLSREVPIDRIKEIISKLKKYNHNINIEVFGHGALCYCYSGQCLMSSFLGGRSGNRGLCAQPCRMRYIFKDYYNTPLSDSNYILSTKDLCTYNNVDKFIEAGVNCIKIEGRMKSKEYVSSTTYAYYKALNGIFEKEDYLLLNLAFNRGLTDGYIFNKSANEVVGRNRSGNKGYPIGKVISSNANTVTIKFISKRFPTKIVNGDGLKFEHENSSCGMYVSRIISQNKNKITLKLEKNLIVKKDSMVYITYSKYLVDRSKSILNEKNIHKTNIYLDILVNNNMEMEVNARCDLLKESVFFISKEKFEKAKNKPLTKKTINQQLQKTGNTNYTIKKITYKNFQNNIFMPISSINNIRRELLEIIDEKIMNSYIPKKEEKEKVKKNIKNFKNEHYNKNTPKKEEKWNIYINNPKQAEILKDFEYIKSVYYDGNYNYKTIEEYVKEITDDLIQLSKVIPDKEIIWILPQILLDKDLPHISEIIVKLKLNNMNIKIQTDNIGIASNLDVECYGNNLNIYNNYSIEKLSHNPGFTRLQISNEISYEDIKLLEHEKCELEYTIFGHVQLMLTEDNFEDLIEEEITNTYYLVDKRNNKFMIKKDCYNHSHIFDYRTLNLDKKIELLRQSKINNFTIDSRFFNLEDTKKIIEHFEKIKNYENTEKLELTKNNPYFIGNIERGVYKQSP